MANTVFSKNLRKLREDKQISQKSAASSLGISQALLSHYEKGIRECGLDFLKRAADFYKVTTDFMLGISDSASSSSNSKKQSCTINKNNVKNKINDDILNKDGKEYNISAALYKNLLINALAYIFDNLKEAEYKEISVFYGKYISMSIYYLYNFGITEKTPFKDYNFENPYLNNIINGVNLT